MRRKVQLLGLLAVAHLFCYYNVTQAGLSAPRLWEDVLHLVEREKMVADKKKMSEIKMRGRIVRLS
ncbi:MAG: hypothetical protein WBB19_03495 [Desulforhopalus sp.]